MNVIETSDLTKFYGPTLGIENLNLSVEEGEILGFIGPNGAGKTTTIRILLSLIYATSGSATIFGKDVVEFGPEIRKSIGYLPSEVQYYENMRVKELLDYSASFYSKDCSKRINSLSELLKLDTTKKIDELSFGNKKKVGIVQGLLHSPKLIILDEPTGGLDPLIQKNFFDLLKEENDNGATIFFSSHNLGEVQRMCNRVAIIREGKLIKVESIKTLASESYKRVNLKLNKKVEDKYFKLSGVNDLKVSDTIVSFLYKGTINALTYKLVHLDIDDIQIEEADLEEIFMHYYK